MMQTKRSTAYDPNVLAAALDSTKYAARWPVPTPATLAAILGVDSAAFQTITAAALPALGRMQTPPMWVGYAAQAEDAFSGLRSDAVPAEAAPHLLAGLILGAVQRQPRIGFNALPDTLPEEDGGDFQMAANALGLRVPRGDHRRQFLAFAAAFRLPGNELFRALYAISAMLDLRGTLAEAPESPYAWAVLAGVWLARGHWQAVPLP